MNNNGELDGMISYVRDYVDNDVEPDREYGSNSHDNYNSYNYDQVNAAIDIYKRELESKIKKAEMYRMKIIKSDFNDKYKECIIDLLNDGKSEEVFDMMNRDCCYNNNGYRPHEWNKDNINLTFCYMKGMQDACRCKYCGGPVPVLCDSCEFYLGILRDH